MSLVRLALVLCLICLFSTNAFAFGKRGKGLFGRNEPVACQSCPTANCASGNCATGCENGQCFPVTTMHHNAVMPSGQSAVTCINGKCYPSGSTGPITLGSSPVTVPLIWSEPAWKKK